MTGSKQSTYLRKASNQNTASFNLTVQGGGAHSSTFKKRQSRNPAGGTDGSAASSGNVFSDENHKRLSSPASNKSCTSSEDSHDVGAVPVSQADEIIDRFAEEKEESDVFFESQCYLKTKTDRFKDHWAVLLGNDIYCYRNKSDDKHRVMHCLAGTFIKEISEEKCPDTGCTFYPVKIVLPPNKSRILYFDTHSMAKLWHEKLLQACGFSNLFDFYEMSKVLGKGQFGMVKLAEHKITKNQVAIKTVKKANMKQIEVFQQRREIEVLKMCQHNNIIKMVDLFENSDYYFLILEFMSGKDLFDYIQKRGFQLPEARVQELGYQLGIAILYLHKFGIVHRDLKLENIMMSD